MIADTCLYFYYSLRALLSRPLPLDVGRCTCIIAKETVEGERGISVYSLYTNVSFWCTVGVYLYHLALIV